MRATCVSIVIATSLFLSSACHQAVIDTDPKPSVGGTIAGVARTGTNPVIGRRVTATNVTTGSKFDATTGANGGYSIKVPEGTYRIDLETRPEETVAKRPDQTHINNGDLDSSRDFEIALSAAAARPQP